MGLSIKRGVKSKTMDSTVVVALISLAGTLIGSLLGIIATAKLTTYRIEFEYEDGLVSLDENHYGKNGKVVDYELEIESASMERAEELVKRLLQEAGITEFKFNTLSKQARALEASL